MAALPVKSQGGVWAGENSQACGERDEIREDQERGRLEQQVAGNPPGARRAPLLGTPREEGNWQTPWSLGLRAKARAQQVTIRCSGILVGPLAEIFSHRPLLT